MSYDTILTEQRDEVLLITLNRRHMQKGEASPPFGQHD